MSEWIHCNKCFLRFRPNIKFYITTCGHLKCQLCASKVGPENRCLVCSSVCEMVILSSNLKSDVLFFFQPAVEAITRTNQVCSFQLNNTLSLLRAVTAKYTAAKTEIAKNYKIIQELKKQQHSLKLMLKTATGAPHGATRTAVGSSSTLSENTSCETPMSNASSTSFFQFKSPNPRVIRWNQPYNAAKIRMNRRYPNVINSFQSPSDLSDSGSQEFSSAPFDISGSPNMGTHVGIGSMSNHRHAGLGHKPR